MAIDEKYLELVNKLRSQGFEHYEKEYLLNDSFGHKHCIFHKNGTHIALIKKKALEYPVDFIVDYVLTAYVEDQWELNTIRVNGFLKGE